MYAPTGTTTCGACHGEQEQVDELDGIPRFDSLVLRPRNSELVNLEYVREQASICVPDVDPERCAILSALFDHGDLAAAAFPQSARTIYGGL